MDYQTNDQQTQSRPSYHQLYSQSQISQLTQQFQQPIGLRICQPQQVSTTNKGPPTEFQEPIGMCCFQGQFNAQPAQFQQQIPPQQQVKLILDILFLVKKFLLFHE
jgi:hypothetical protein